MILINLLPHREAARKSRHQRFYVTLGSAVLLGLLIAGGVYLWYQARMDDQRTRNQFLQSEIKRLEIQIKDIASLQGEIAALVARQQAVENLQADRNLPVQLLNEIVKQMPGGVYLTALRQTNQTVTLQGVAQSNERVSELLRNLANESPWLTRPELIEIVAGSVTLSARDVRRVANFSMRVQLRRASEVAQAAAKNASAASTPASGVPSVAALAASKR